MRRPLASIAFASLLFVMGPVREAAGQPTAPDIARAVDLFEEGKAKLAKGNVAEACRAFVESYRIDPQIGTLLNTALCHEREGKHASAWAEFTSVVALSNRAGQTKRADFARDRARRLEPKLTRVRVSVREASEDLAVSIDGEPVKVDALRAGPVPLDPGSHRVRASAPSKRSWEGEWTIADSPSTVAEVVIPELDPEPAPAPPSPPTNDLALAEASRPRALSRTLAYTTGGLAVAATAVGAVAGFVAISARREADDGCSGSVCRTREAFEANERAFTAAGVSTAAFVTAGVLAATTVVLFLVSPRASASAPVRTAFTF